MLANGKKLLSANMFRFFLASVFFIFFLLIIFLRHRFFVERAPFFSTQNIAKQSPMGRHPNPREAAYVHQDGAGLTQPFVIVNNSLRISVAWWMDLVVSWPVGIIQPLTKMISNFAVNEFYKLMEIYRMSPTYPLFLSKTIVRGRWRERDLKDDHKLFIGE